MLTGRLSFTLIFFVVAFLGCNDLLEIFNNGELGAKKIKNKNKRWSSRSKAINTATPPAVLTTGEKHMVAFRG